MEIVLPEQCTIEEAESIKESLLLHLNDAEKTVLSFRNVADADLSLFQLLHSAVRTWSQENRELELLQDLPAHLEGKARLAGFSYLAAAPTA